MGHNQKLPSFLLSFMYKTLYLDVCSLIKIPGIHKEKSKYHHLHHQVPTMGHILGDEFSKVQKSTQAPFAMGTQ